MHNTPDGTVRQFSDINSQWPTSVGVNQPEKSSNAPYFGKYMSEMRTRYYLQQNAG